MRDKPGREIDFKQVCDESVEDYNFYLTALNGGGLDQERTKAIVRRVVMNPLWAAESSYSLGSDKEIIKNYLSLSVEVIAKYFEFKAEVEEFEVLLKPISIAILTGLELDVFKLLTKVVERDKVSDKLLDFLIKYKQPDWKGNSSNFIQNEPYKAISKAIDEPDGQNGIKLLQTYLSPKVWYAGHSDAGWYDSHKNKRVNTYSGYWAWEAAALVKAKGWNDEALKGTDYYPYDAVHW